ncbi:hypothetical protein M8818_000269 [Zalaria obscura]|uniref:Uncharacterized protein n=1 Tax=Zalaria obscura TaxID=2024903 RepID=A0ACC3SPK1_9PEZI
MARKYIADDSDDDLPDLDQIISKHMRTLPPPTALSNPLFSPVKSALKRETKRIASPRKTTASATANEEFRKPSKQKPVVKELELELPKPSLRAGKKVPLKPAQGNAETIGVDESKDDGSDTPPRSRSLARARATPRRGAKTGVNYAALMDAEEDEGDIEESIWCGAESESETEKEQDQAEESDEWEEEMPSRRRLFRSPRKTSSNHKPLDGASDLSKTLGRLDLQSDNSATEEGKKLRSPRKKLRNPSFTQEDDSTLPHDPSDKENSLPAILHFSPPRSGRPITLPPERPSTPTDRPSTPPPLSPSKSRLVSPSKKKPRIPTPPHRPSLDAFWHADEINTWNDTHSPSKPLQSPRKNRFLDSTSTSPTTSPRKQSPTKRTKAEIEARKAWEDSKHDLAAAFLEELDRTVTEGRIGEATEGTGGVRLVWSKTLTSTAGRANWKRETIRPASTSSSKPNTPPAPDSVTDSSVTTPAPAPAPAPAAVAIYKHHASIELAEKVIDAPHRLLNTLAHEFCHLATFILDGQTKNPHGREFKTWGKKTSKLFAARGVEVTTKHSYQIAYRYIWRCFGAIGNGDGDGDGDEGGGCGTEFKRHSRSIDPSRHACGNCRGRLVQVKPVPRKGAAKGAGVGGYALFVKENFAVVRRGLGEGGGKVEHKMVMEELGRLYRVQKEKGLVEGGTVTPTGEVEVEMEGEVEGVIKAMEMVVLGE